MTAARPAAVTLLQIAFGCDLLARTVAGFCNVTGTVMGNDDYEFTG